MAPPANDNFASAITLTGASGSESGTVFEATREASESSTLFGGTVARSVWYKWTCPASGWYKWFIDAADFVPHNHASSSAYWCGMELFNDDVLSAHTFTSALATSQTINNEFDDFDYSPHIAAECVSGNVYYIRLASQNQLGLDDYSSFDFVLQWNAVDTPANDLIANAIDLDPLPATTGPITTKDNTPQSGEQTTLGGIGNFHQSQWFKFTPTTTGKHYIRVLEADVSKDNNNQLDRTSQVRVYIGTMSGTTLTLVSGAGSLSAQLIQDDVSMSTEAMYADLTSGTEYHVIVCSGWEQKYVGGNYQFNGQTAAIAEMTVDLVVGPANDNFASPTALSTTLPSLLTGQTNRNAKEEAGENFPFVPNDVQAIWYSFTPDHNGKYRFRLPVDSLEYNGDFSLSWGEIIIALTAATTIGGVTGADFLPAANSSDAGYSDPGWINVHSPTIVADLVSGTTYRFIAWSERPSNDFNKQVMTFDVAVDEVLPPDNDDFADRITITGASGSEAVAFLGATTETDEPFSFFWNEDFTTGDQVDNMASIWYEWVAPATGWYEFKIECNDGSAPDMGIYTGSALNALTAIARNSGGTLSEINQDSGATTIRFHATNATSYKIQLACNEGQANSLDIQGDLTWATASAPTNDTTGSVLGSASYDEELVNNFGNTDDELPPDWLARLSAHGDFWYNDGQVGRSKWFTYTSPGNVTLVVKGEQYDLGGYFTYNEYALLVYKGNDYASLVAAEANSTEDGIMIGYEDEATTIDNNQRLEFDLTTGETVWVCMVGMFDKDYNGNASGLAQDEIDCPQTEIHFTMSTGAPLNDNRSGLLGLFNDYHYWLGLTHWFGDDYYTEREAMQGVGSTFSASTQVGDPATIGGFTATRTVWFMVLIDKPGTWKFWVESSVDAVLGIYDYDGTATLGTLIAEDDDSGPGNQPEIVRVFSAPEANFQQYWIGVDTKTEGDFVFKCQRQSDGTPPANDDFADAVVIASVPFSQSGTTVDATCEPAEHDSGWLGLGPKDTVWYKFDPPGNGQYKVWAQCDSDNLDAYVHYSVWRGTTLDNLVALDPTWEMGNKGWGDFFDTEQENKDRGLVFEYEGGESYYIRVETEEGGSEDFTIYFDEAPIYFDIQVSGSEEMHGTLLDDAEVYIDIQASGTEIHHISQTEDAATVLIDIQPSGIEFTADEYLDSTTVYVDIQMLGGECFSAHTGLMMDAEADPRWLAVSDCRWQVMDVRPRWEVEDVQSEGVHC